MLGLERGKEMPSERGESVKIYSPVTLACRLCCALCGKYLVPFGPLTFGKKTANLQCGNRKCGALHYLEKKNAAS